MVCGRVCAGEEKTVGVCGRGGGDYVCVGVCRSIIM